jgi:hypothetical protein
MYQMGVLKTPAPADYNLAHLYAERNIYLP